MARRRADQPPADQSQTIDPSAQDTAAPVHPESPVFAATRVYTREGEILGFAQPAEDDQWQPVLGLGVPEASKTNDG